MQCLSVNPFSTSAKPLMAQFSLSVRRPGTGPWRWPWPRPWPPPLAPGPALSLRGPWCWWMRLCGSWGSRGKCVPVYSALSPGLDAAGLRAPSSRTRWRDLLRSMPSPLCPRRDSSTPPCIIKKKTWRRRRRRKRRKKTGAAFAVWSSENIQGKEMREGVGKDLESHFLVRAEVEDDI